VEASRHDAGTAYACFDRHTFGDMTPWVFKTSDFGKTWTRIATSDNGVRGYAHVVKEDAVSRDLLFVGTELGLFVSLDGGARFAEFKGGDFPRVAVRDLQLQTREDDLVVATHGRGIWIIDDLAPLRALTAKTLAQRAAFLPGRPVQQRMRGLEGWAEGDASYLGRNPPDGAVITYYQRDRHLYGRLKLEVLDPSGKVVDKLNATKRRGINRVVWGMQMKPARVPRAAQVAYNATQGPRIVPGNYTVRLTKGADVIETKLQIGLDRRAPFTVADRKLQFEAASRIQTMFAEMSALTDRIDAARNACEARAKALPGGDSLAPKLKEMAGKLQDVKSKIVATKEGGAITGEERIREHLDLLYGAVNGWEGRPARYLLERTDVLRRELGDVQKAFDELVAGDVRALDAPLKERKLAPIPTTAMGEPTPASVEENTMAALRCLSRARECRVTREPSAHAR
jgi:hypothetical protein